MTVQPGDSLLRIAQRVRGERPAPAVVEEILRANPGLDTRRIAVGQPLRVPAPAAPPQPVTQPPAVQHHEHVHHHHYGEAVAPAREVHDELKSLRDELRKTREMVEELRQAVAERRRSVGALPSAETVDIARVRTGHPVLLPIPSVPDSTAPFGGFPSHPAPVDSIPAAAPPAATVPAATSPESMPAPEAREPDSAPAVVPAAGGVLRRAPLLDTFFEVSTGAF